MKNVLTLILGGGRGARLYPLTKHRSEPAVPLAGKYRLIDIPISNCLNSGLNQIFVLTQFLSVSLHRHIAQTYKADPFQEGFVEVLAAQQTNEAAQWYLGTADALRQNIPYMHHQQPSEILVLSGDQLFRLDFARMIAHHRQRKADATLAVVPVPRERASELGIIRLAEDGHRICQLHEKPKTDAELAPFHLPPNWLEERGIASNGRPFLANMGIYLFNRPALVDLLKKHQPTSHDLVQGVLNPCLKSHRIEAYLVDQFWEDLGTIKTYHQTHMALLADDPLFDFYRPNGVIFTRMRNLPPSRVLAGKVEQCLIADGCLVQTGAELSRCIVGVRSQIGERVRCREVILLGADHFETDEQKADNRRQGIPDVGIGEGSIIERAIVDKDCRIGRNVRILNQGNIQHADCENYVIREGIVVIPNETIIPDGTVI